MDDSHFHWAGPLEFQAAPGKRRLKTPSNGNLTYLLKYNYVASSGPLPRKMQNGLPFPPIWTTFIPCELE